MQFEQDSQWRAVPGPQYRNGYIGINLTQLREINSNDIPAMSDSPLGGDPAGFGGLLCKNTTPILEYVNGDTDSAWRLRWAATNVDKVGWAMMLPGDLDFSQPLLLNIIAAMGGTADTPILTLESFFGKGDTKISDTSAAVTGTTEAIYTITIAGADLETNVRKRFASFELTTAAHGTDTLLIYGLELQYTKR